MSAKRHASETSTRKRTKKEKRGASARLNPELREDAVRGAVTHAWRNQSSYSHGSVQLDCEPFPHCKISNFIHNETFVENVHKELLQLNFNSKSNDLYKFKQSDDLKNRKEHHISEMRSVIFEQFRTWLSEIVGVDLEPTIDMSCAKYEHTDVLLCHDDELEGRRVAFILYLVPSWDLCDGGTLDLYSTDEHCQPVGVVKSLLPSWNTLTFFEVSPVSFHQVSEVLSEGKCRLSVSGWFHGPSLQRPPCYVEPAVSCHTHIPRDETVLSEWVNEVYLGPLYQAQIQQEFESSSEIRLANFLQEEKFKQVSEALRLAEIQWERRGPPNKRCYASAELERVPACLKECWELLSSEPFFLLLSNLTGLSLHYLSQSDGDAGAKEAEAESSQGEGHGCDTEEKNTGPPTCAGELRRWTHGDYTLLHDSTKREFALDLLLHLGCTGWNPEFGGFTSYIAHDEDEELLTVYPEDNSLALVYRDKETLKFVKHINQSSIQADHTAHYDFSFTYYE